MEQEFPPKLTVYDLQCVMSGSGAGFHVKVFVEVSTKNPSLDSVAQ
jgi:hypothetical protein